MRLRKLTHSKRQQKALTVSKNRLNQLSVIFSYIDYVLKMEKKQ
mgnify:FL=1